MPAVAQRSLLKSTQSRVFTIRGRAGPANPPVYQSVARAQAASWPQGDITPIRIPDPDNYEQFLVVDQIRGQQGLPTLGLQFRMSRELSDVLQLVREGCAFDVQIHMGACKNPSDFNNGWEKILVIEGAQITSYDTDELGALDSDQNVIVNETVSVTGLDMYEIKPLLASELAAAEIVQEVIDVAICDSQTCGECGIQSDGCQKIFAITLSAGGSPGLPAEILYSENGGGTFGDTNVTTLGANEDPNALACVGSNLAVVSEDDEALHYAPVADILDGAETWTRVTTGFVATKGPKDIFSLGRSFTWIAAEGGYVYFASDITAGVEVQTAGSVTTQDLNKIHGYDINNLVIVGNSNAVLLTQNGGTVWALITGPAVGVALNAVWMLSKTEWLVGTAGGALYYTRDSGDTWTLKAFPGSGSGVVYDIVFSTPTVGYLAHTTAAGVGRILRTIDGGNTWYVLPESIAAMPDNDRITALAACEDDPNVVYGAGLGANATDGFLVKAA